MGDPSSEIPLPESVDRLIDQICVDQKQSPLRPDQRRKLASMGEDESLQFLQKIASKKIKKNLCACFNYFYSIQQQQQQQQQQLPTPPTPTPLFGTPPRDSMAVSTSEAVPNTDIANSPSSSHPSATVVRLFGSPRGTGLDSTPSSNESVPNSAKAECQGESSGRAVLEALGELEFRKQFLILNYSGGLELQTVTSAEEIRGLRDLPMIAFESRVWNLLGQRYVAKEDRRMYLDWDSGRTHIFHCLVSLDGNYRFKGPYLDRTRTHLQKVLGDDNILMVKFAEDNMCPNPIDCYYATYSKIAREGILAGLRRYHFFVFKDGGKEEKKKNPNSSSVKCYFIRMGSDAYIDKIGSYKLLNKTIAEARSYFMHADMVSSVPTYMARLSLILSKTISMDTDLSSVVIERIEDEYCKDNCGNCIFRDEKPLIHTDGTGFISEDLALLCPKNVLKGDCLSKEDIEGIYNHERKQLQEPPLLIQCRLFNNGCAVKGTFLLNKKLPHRTMQIRDSMIKVESDENLSSNPTANSMEIVTTSNPPRKTYLSRNLIALLTHGGVPNEYFINILQKALQDAHGAFRNKRAALRVSIKHSEIDDNFTIARMILSGIPLEECFLQYRLSILMKEEKKSLGEGRLYVPECYYLMGTADPTGKLESDEVCIVLENGQISGKVLVYRNPGLHFGDIHVLKATYVKELDPFIGNAKYAIFFSCKGPRSVADEIAGGDFDGDMYWISRNPQLLEYFKSSEPWNPSSTMHKVAGKRPNLLSDDELDDELFKLFLKTRFQPSFVMGEAAASWLALMDRFLTLGSDNVEEKKQVKKNILQLIDIYYDALDAPKKGGKVELPNELKVRLFPHFMGKKNHYKSTSILGLIYDAVEESREEDLSNQEIKKLPCFDVEVPEACFRKWKMHYDQYRTEMSIALLENDKCQRNKDADQVIKKYKKILYDAEEFEQSARNMDDIYNEAVAIYHLTYDYAKSIKSAQKCMFAWKVAGPALLKIYIIKQSEKSFLCLPSVMREIFG